MNANNWPLDEMERLEFIVPYPVEECAQRIEGLHENQRRPIKRNIFWQTWPDRPFRYFRKVVTRHIDKESTTYSVGWVWSWLPYKSQNTSTEVNVQILADSHQTLVSIIYSRRWSVIQKSMMGAVLAFGGLGGFCMVGPYIQDGNFPLAFGCILIWLGLMCGLEAYVYGQMKNQRNQLFTQICGALDIDCEPSSTSRWGTAWPDERQ